MSLYNDKNIMNNTPLPQATVHMYQIVHNFWAIDMQGVQPRDLNCDVMGFGWWF